MREIERKRFEAHERLKMTLRLRGTSLAEISRSLGVSRTTMSLVGLRKLHNASVEKALADAMGLSVSDLFLPIDEKENER